ncbi:MAG: integrase arm-type DNA-binding domain-containing protein [Pseudomonadota bacterium]
MARNLITGDAAIRALKLGAKRLNDGDGLYLLPFVKGGAHGWRFDYPINGVRKTLSLGTYPDTGLALARKKADEYRKLVASGTDPSDVRKAKRAAELADAEAKARGDAGLPPSGSFEAVAREFHQTRREGWSPQYFVRWLERMEKDLFPRLGRAPLSSITAPQILVALRVVEARGANETAHNLRQYAGQVFTYGIATGHCDRNPAVDLAGTLRTFKVKNAAALTEPKQVGALMRSIDAYEGHPITRSALLLSALLFQRPGNMRTMAWVDVDLEDAMWRIPSADMKRTVEGKLEGRPHLVPLPTQAVGALRELHPLTGHSKFVFPSLVSSQRPMSENTTNTALRRMGIGPDEMVAHGFRAMARTMLVERLDANPDVIEAQLAHTKSGPLGSAYDRAAFVAQRRDLMQRWADYLDQLRTGAKRWCR